MQKSDFRVLTNPRSIAVVGASSPERSWFGGRAFRNAVQGNPDRHVYPINARMAGEELMGRKIFADIRELPEVPDICIVVTPSPTVPEVLESIGQAKCRHVLLFSANRSEDPVVRGDYFRQIQEIAVRHSLCLVGGNSIGIISPHNSLLATFSSASDFSIRPGGTAYISQSGAAFGYLVAALRERPIGYSHLISTGDENLVTLPDMLEQVVDDDKTESIVLFLEGSSNGADLRRALTKARAIGKPVAALKVGRTAVGRLAAQSHTGRLTGDEDVYRALFAEAGVSVAESYEQLHDIAYRIGMVGTRGRRGNRAAIATSSGGTSVVASDGLVERGWILPPPSEATCEKLTAAGANPAANPLDVTGAFQVKDRLASLIGVLSDSDEYDEIFFLTGSGGNAAKDVVQHINDMGNRLTTTVSCAWIAPPDESVIQKLEAVGIPVYLDPMRTVLAATAHRLASPNAAERAEAVARLKLLEKPVRPPKAAGTSPTAAELFAQLTEAGIRCAPWAAVSPSASRQDIVAAAQSIGYPVVLKIDSGVQLHKTEVGGVVTGIASDAELLEAQARLQKVVGGEAGSSLLVQKMIRGGVEVLVGVRWDPSFGPVLALGLGGVLAELLADVRITLLPATPAQLDRALDGHERLATMLAGYRGSPRADSAALRQMVHALAKWIGGPGADYSEIDFNPIIVTPDGAFVVDARAIVGASAGNSHD